MAGQKVSEPIRCSRANNVERFIAFVCHPSADIPPRSALETRTLVHTVPQMHANARKCFVTIVAVNCTCQPDIIDPARGEELRTWVEGTE